MTTFADRPHAALLVIDVQNAVVAQARRRDKVVATVAGLVNRARLAGVPVVWGRHADKTLHAGSAAWQIVPELIPEADEPVVDKGWRDAFDDTGLEQILAQRAVGRLIVTGAQTDFCVRSTLRGALMRGYDAILVDDAHTTDDMVDPGAPSAKAVIRHTNLYWAQQCAPGRRGSVMYSHEEVFAG